ncbi:MAG: MarR family winged helix-turn-helix transcriptional regulator [Treponemataceae bacterium]|nr:MarR family winged helix-turn-helix transcriptional regulator [Treponemataceae bacterium]
MKSRTSLILSLISKIHAQSASFLKLELQERGLPEMVSSHGNILFQLSRNEKMSMKELADAIHRDKSTVTALVSKLREQGYVEKVLSEADSRVVFVRLTEKGKKYTVDTQAISSLLNEKCLAGFSDQDKDALYELLSRISTNFAG